MAVKAPPKPAVVEQKNMVFLPATCKQATENVPFKPMYKLKTSRNVVVRFFFMEAHLQSMDVREYGEHTSKTYLIHWPHIVGLVLGIEDPRYPGNDKLCEVGIAGVRGYPSKPYENTKLYHLPFINLGSTNCFCGSFRYEFSNKKPTMENCQEFLNQAIYSPWIIENGDHRDMIESTKAASDADPDWFNKGIYANIKSDYTIAKYGQLYG